MEFFVPSIEDMENIRSALAHNAKRCCDMAPANIVLWAKHYHTEIAFWREDIIFRSKREDGKYSYTCNLLTAAEAKKLFDGLVEWIKSQGQPVFLHCMTEEEVELINGWYPEAYQVEYNRDFSDYVYLREKLAELTGKKLHGKRNHIHRFEEQNPDWRYEQITDDNEEECAKMAMQWCMKNCMGEENAIEYDKIDESRLVVYAIRHRRELGLIGGAIRTKGRIIAVTLGERLTEDTFVVHFEKALSEIQGAYPIINREFVRNELSAYAYVNREEDLGEEGLRRSKLSYRPELLVKKGNLREQEEAV
ncbi:MAG: phosphatidylglycerol lysyltransferase domain-containing protein [Bacteroidales bacterium]|nr:phosphatidylglycerol lysyltransferase domain-containing protein [Clostridium sp.]MCM1202884.1 phosphatidylglycerol lysyltransferase domain-containing protein [Bacteroidales bacterium]